MRRGMLASHARTSARGPLGPQAPSKVSIDERAEGGPFILPLKAVNAPGTNHQVADQSDESRPIR
eukprot:5136098-Alexandrium_andersonii.AAC.1